MKKLLIFLIITVAVLILAFSSVYVIAEDETACVVKLSKIDREVIEPGLYFKIPFLESVKKYPQKTLAYDIKPSDIYTKDQYLMSVDFYILWEIEKPQLFYQTIGEVDDAPARLDGIAYNIVKNIISKKEQSEIINEEDAAKRNDLYREITNEVNANAAQYGIIVSDVKIKRFELVEDNENEIYDLMIASRNKSAAEFISIAEYEASKKKVDADKDYNTNIAAAKLEAQQKIAEGEQEYMRILAEAFDTQEKQDFYQFVRSLDVLKASLNGEDKTVILSKDSELAKLLLGLE